MNEKYFEYKGQDRKASVMASAIANALSDFCEQEAEFEQAIVQSKKTFTDCMDAVAKGIGNSISDIDAIKKAVKFYFSVADVSFVMKIDLCGNNGASKEEPKKLEFTLEDLF